MTVMAKIEHSQLEAERSHTRELLQEAKLAGEESARVAERLRLATRQYQERLDAREGKHKK